MILPLVVLTSQEVFSLEHWKSSKKKLKIKSNQEDSQD